MNENYSHYYIWGGQLRQWFPSFSLNHPVLPIYLLYIWPDQLPITENYAPKDKHTAYIFNIFRVYSFFGIWILGIACSLYGKCLCGYTLGIPLLTWKATAMVLWLLHSLTSPFFGNGMCIKYSSLQVTVPFSIAFPGRILTDLVSVAWTRSTDILSTSGNLFLQNTLKWNLCLLCSCETNSGSKLFHSG